MSTKAIDFTTITELDKEVLMKHFPDGVIAFDTETTGLSPLFDKIIEISAVKVTRDSITVFDQLINPSISIENSQFHGISNEMVKDAPNTKSVLKDFQIFCKDLPLIAHNARFDTGFATYEAFKNEMTLGENDIYDSCHFARMVFKNEASKFGLAYMTKYLSIPLYNHHRALDDSLAALLVFSRSLLHKKKEVDKTWSEKRGVKDAFLFNLKDYHQPLENLPKRLELLKEHTPTQIPLLIKYKGGTMKNEFREVKPVSLLPLPMGNVLYALCLRTNIYKNYALKKIAEVKKIED